MAHWSRPSDLNELRELERETSPRVTHDLRWFAGAFTAGIALVLALGFGTNIFDSGPTELDVGSAYREGFEQGTSEAEAYWEEALADAYWEGFSVGNAEGSREAPDLYEGMRRRFSWDGGYEAGLRSAEVNLDDQYWEGWLEGFASGWSSVTAIPVPHPAALDSYQGNVRDEGGGR